MQANLWSRWLLACLLLLSICFIATYARRGGGGSRPSASRPSYSRPSYSRPSPSYSRPSPSYSRPAPAPAPRPAPAPAPRPAPAPAPRPPPAPAPRPPPAPAPRPPPAPAPSKPSEPVVVRQPAYNPDFKEPNLRPGVGDRQPAYNPNYKPDAPGGPPPPYSPYGQPAPNVPGGPPPKYESSGSFGNPPPGLQPPPYPGPAVRPPAYPGLGPSYPVQSGGSQPNRPYPVQPGYPGSVPNQPSINRPYPVQPGYPGSVPNQPSNNRPYPVQPGYTGGFHSQPNYPGSFRPPNINRPYPVQPGMHYSYPGVSRPYPQQPLGGNVWQPHYGVPAPAYMNYGGIPTGTNIYTKPHKKKGFIGSLMSLGKSKHEKKNKYYGSYPSPYGVGHMGGSGLGHAGGFLGKHSSSASLYTIFPYMAAKSVRKIHKPKFSFMPIYIPRSHYHYYHYHHHHGGYSRGENLEMDPKYSEYFDIYNEDYVGKCQQPIKKKYSEIKCKATFNETECVASCENGYAFANSTADKKNKCWHITGVWRPQKNFPDCKPVCNNECMNGGECIRPEVCKCQPEFRGDRCQFNFLKCNILSLIKKEEEIGWVCYHTKNETVCKIRCKEPAQFESPPAEKYSCTPDGVWTPNTVPHCKIKGI